MQQGKVIQSQGDQLERTQSLSNNEYAQRFELLSQLLFALNPLWQLVAFECKDLPWQQAYPKLANAVNGLEDDEIDAIDADPQRLFECLLPSLKADLAQSGQDNVVSLLALLDCDFPQLASLSSSLETTAGTHLGSYPGTYLGTSTDINPTTNPNINPNINPNTDAETIADMDGELSHFSAHIKGRKWQQITTFTQACFTLAPKGLPILEWCAGKGHLGRLVAKTQDINVTSLEWQQGLCEQGQSFADKWQLPQQFICADAFKEIDQKNSPIKAQQHAIALHACGDLHVRLLQLARQANTQGISISPCCYHLIQSEYYQPLSQLAQTMASQDKGLNLTRHHLQLPLQHSVIANQKKQLRRHQEVLWRLSFDSLQRDVSGNDSYLPIPSLKQSQLSGTFAAFCHWAAAQKGLALPEGLNLDKYIEQGLQRRKLTLRLDLVSHLFRQALETWLLLDRACFLQEGGYRVSVSKFCSNSITPRNGFIQALKY
jgi:hypothetical protein